MGRVEGIGKTTRLWFKISNIFQMRLSTNLRGIQNVQGHDRSKNTSLKPKQLNDALEGLGNFAKFLFRNEF